MKNNVRYELASEDYAQSANTLFHFMKKPEYLKELLEKRALIPRYCMENVRYLNIHKEGVLFSEVFILEKCFCDIPFHKLAETFQLKGTGEKFDSLSEDEQKHFEGNNTHPGLYGKYAVAFSKNWGEVNGLQPVHYVNPESSYTANLSKLLNLALNEEETSDSCDDNIIDQLSMIKPLRGEMKREYMRSNGQRIEIVCNKNFHDEREWRYIPDIESLSETKLEQIVANPRLLSMYDGDEADINRKMSDNQYRSLWLNFSYKDIRYLLVPNETEREDVVDIIMKIPNENFDDCSDIQNQKYILISKILVMDEIRKDW